MPKRFLKPGLTTSEHWNSCSFEAQSFYVRLITLVDDYGRYDGRAKVLRSHAFPLTDDISIKRIEELCGELVTSKLAIFYISGEKVAVQLLRWEEKPRSEPKFPEFANNCKQLYASANNCSGGASVPVGEDEGVHEGEDEGRQQLELLNKRQKFEPPSLKDVCDRAVATGSTVQIGEACFHYYQSNGWKVGKNPMKDWHSALSGWINRDQNGGNGTTHSKRYVNPDIL